MTLESQIPAIKQYYTKLHNVQSLNHVQTHLLDLLAHLQHSSNTFSVSACIKSPFYDEFCTTIKGQCTHEDTCFSLLECLIIFCREKQLRIGKKENLPQIEQNILNFYEESDLWSFEDTTLVNMWYWQVLPNSLENIK